MFLCGQLTFSTDISYSKFWEKSIALAPKNLITLFKNRLTLSMCSFKVPLLPIYIFNSNWSNNRNTKESITLCRYSDILDSCLYLQFSEKAMVTSMSFIGYQLSTTGSMLSEFFFLSVSSDTSFVQSNFNYLFCIKFNTCYL